MPIKTYNEDSEEIVKVCSVCSHEETLSLTKLTVGYLENPYLVVLPPCGGGCNSIEVWNRPPETDIGDTSEGRRLTITAIEKLIEKGRITPKGRSNTKEEELADREKGLLYGGAVTHDYKNKAKHPSILKREEQESANLVNSKRFPKK